jgi:adenylate cyclase
MSGDVEQEYFSDGITEDVITDLSKVSALAVVSRNSSFVYKGKSVDVPKLARELNVTHVLEGSVRKAGGRVRITAQLIDGVTNEHLWAERYDRDLNDIFALQDEIAEALVRALKVALLPEEKQAIERRGTNKLEAYHLYLMARQHAVFGSTGDVGREEALIRLCGRAVEIDPGYARAWALLAYGQMSVQRLFGQKGDCGLMAAERALRLDADLAEAHAIKASILAQEERHEEANAEIAVALRLDPKSWEVARQAARICFLQRRLRDAAAYFETAAALSEVDVTAPADAICCYMGSGDLEDARRAARMALARSEKVLVQHPSNGSAISAAVRALAVLGEEARAREWIGRALLIDSNNMIMRYDFACALAAQMKDADAALEMLRPVLEKIGRAHLKHAQADPDFDGLRSDPRFQIMIAAAEERIAAEVV